MPLNAATTDLTMTSYLLQERESFPAPLIETAPVKTAACSSVAVIPAYNESRFIGSVVLEARKHVCRVIVVDDGSADTTAAIARDAGASVIVMDENGGKAQAVMAGLQRASLLSPQAVVLLDGDGQHDATEIPSLLEPVLNGVADLVIGTRFGAITSHIPGWRKVGQHALTHFTNFASGVSSTDSQSGFRAFAADILPLVNFTTSGFSLESEMQFIARENDLRVCEVPISVVYAERAKRNPVKQALQVINGVLKLVGMNRPLLFFAIPGVSLLLFGTIVGLLIVRIYQQTTELAVGYALICIMLLIIGTTATSTGIILHSLRAWLLNWKQGS